MNIDNLKTLLKDLKVVIAELESEIYSDPSSYSSNDSLLDLDLDSVLNYAQTNDNDSEEGL